MALINRTSKFVSLITGGASGLGLATAKNLIRLGGRVVICDLPASNGDAIAKEIDEDRCLFVPTNVVFEKDVRVALDTALENFGALHNVVNCAGVTYAVKLYSSLSERVHEMEIFNKMLEVNTLGTFNVIRLAVPEMLKNTPDKDGHVGCVINTSGISAFDGQRGQVGFSASTGAINSMTLPLARDLSSLGIRVCTIAPGIFSTPLVTSMPDSAINILSKLTPFPHRLGKPEEFAHLVQTIINNPMMNGETIRLDGAIRMQP